VTLFGSHPPGDVAFRDDLMGAALGDWHVETGGRERYFRVTYANTFDEPVGGLMNVILSEDGQHYKRLDITSVLGDSRKLPTRIDRRRVEYAQHGDHPSLCPGGHRPRGR
jgi:hypothetical protein